MFQARVERSKQYIQGKLTSRSSITHSLEIKIQPEADGTNQTKSSVSRDRNDRLTAKVDVDDQLSPAENALILLRSILPLHMHEDIRAAVVYTISVLGSDPALTTVPVALHPKQEEAKSNDPEDDSSCVRSWLLSSYTPITTPQPHEPTQQDHTLQEAGSTAAQPARALFFEGGSPELTAWRRPRSPPLDCGAADLAPSPSARPGIAAALQGIARWDWDILALQEVTFRKTSPAVTAVPPALTAVTAVTPAVTAVTAVTPAVAPAAILVLRAVKAGAGPSEETAQVRRRRRPAVGDWRRRRGIPESVSESGGGRARVGGARRIRSPAP